MAIEIVSRLNLADRIEFMRTLASWLTSGGGRMPVNEAIRNTCEAFSRDDYRAYATRMTRITSEYDTGQVTFARALKVADVGFNEQELQVISAAERSNQLRAAIPDMVDALEMQLNAKRTLVRRMSMPVIGGFMLIVMSLGVAKFMLPLVLGPVLQRKPDALAKFPSIIRGYWYFSVWMQDHWLIPLVVVCAPVALFIFRNTPFLKPIFERIVMSIGPLQRLSMAYNGVLVVYYMPALVKSGMPMHEVFRTVANALSNQTIAGAFRIAANEHEAGMRAGDSLAKVPLRSSFRSAVDAGERTGAIAERIEDLKAPYAAEYDRIIRRSVGTLMVVVMAGLLPFFIMSMYTSLVAPIFALMEF